MKHCMSRVFRAWHHAGLRDKGGQFSSWAWERSSENEVGKMEEGIVLCGALGIDYVEFDVSREI